MASRSSAVGHGDHNPHIVVVGAGYAGSNLALQLQKKKIQFTLIDARDVQHHNIAAVRAAIVPGFVKKTLIPLKPVFGDSFRRGRVVGIRPDDKSVELEDGDTVRYDILVLATGTNGPFPCKLSDQDTADITTLYDNCTDKVKASRRIVLIGGGAVGVEIAGEIATEYPDKEVTLIHSRNNLVREELSASFQKRLRQILTKLNVKLLTGERVINMEGIEGLEAGTVTTDKGTTIQADLIIKCTGLTVNSTAYSDSMRGDLSSNGSLKVNKYLQVDSHQDIFAIGDCSASGDPWMTLHAYKHADLVFQNIQKLIKGSTLKANKPERSDRGGMVGVSLGRNNGIGQLDSGLRLPEFLIKKLKSSDLLVKKTWSAKKQKPPT